MQIVIELSDETYKDIKEENSIYGINNGLSARMTGKVVGAIQNGKPLPKGHGRLIDADEAIQRLCGKSCGCTLEECGYKAPCFSVQRINSAQIVIEADKEQEK